MQGKYDEKIKFYRFPTMKTEQTTGRHKKWITAMKRKDCPKSVKQIDNARLCSKHFATVAKSDDPLHIDYIHTVQYLLLSLWLVPKGREKVLIDMKDLKNLQETRTKKKKEKTPNKNETAACLEQIEFEIADKGTQTEEAIRRTLSKQKLRKKRLLKKQVKKKKAQIKELIKTLKRKYFFI